MVDVVEKLVFVLTGALVGAACTWWSSKRGLHLADKLARAREARGQELRVVADLCVMQRTAWMEFGDASRNLIPLSWRGYAEAQTSESPLDRVRMTAGLEGQKAYALISVAFRDWKLAEDALLALEDYAASRLDRTMEPTDALKKLGAIERRMLDIMEATETKLGLDEILPRRSGLPAPCECEHTEVNGERTR